MRLWSLLDPLSSRRAVIVWSSTVDGMEARPFPTSTCTCLRVVGLLGPQVEFVGGMKGGSKMTTVVRKENESIEDALKRFKREIRKVGVLREARKHEHYEKPSEIKKRKKATQARNKHRKPL